eukprot:15337168-Ditylum_brightwellii.AAC.1
MDTALVEETTTQAMPNFTTFVFGTAGIPNPAPTPPTVDTTPIPPASTDLNDHMSPDNTFASNRTTPLIYT